jgi:CheY-like chemotaxis protein
VITIMVLAEAGFVNEFRLPVEFTYLADTVIILRQDLDPDVLICDLAMPEMDGYKVLENVRRLESERGQLPVIAFTAAARDEDRTATRLAGFQAHLSKPIEPEKLVKTVLEIFSYKNAG